MSLTKQELDLLFIYDRSSGKLFNKIDRTSNARAGQEAGFYIDGYRVVEINYVPYKVHRIIWCMETGNWPIRQIDHINGIRDDNRIENLRDVSPRGNSRNRAKSSRNTSGEVGVYLHKETGRWRAMIRVDQKLIHLGLFKDKQDAIRARKRGENKYGFHENHGR